MARDHEINPRNTLMICRKLQSHFNSYNKESPSKKSAQKVIAKLLYRRDIRAFKIICRDINDEQAFDMLKSVISRNYTTLQKLCLGFVGLTDELGIDLLLHLTSFSDCNIYYIGKRIQVLSCFHKEFVSLSLMLTYLSPCDTRNRYRK